LCHPPETVLEEMILKHTIIFPDSITRLCTATTTPALLSHSTPLISRTAQTSSQGLCGAAANGVPPTLPTTRTGNTVGYQHLSTHVKLPFSKGYPHISTWLLALDVDSNRNSPTKPRQFSSLAPQFEAENMKTIDEIILLGFEQMHSLLGIKVGDAMRLERLAWADIEAGMGTW